MSPTEKNINNIVTLDVLMDMLMFEDLETANEKLAPYHMKARWVDENRGDVEVVSIFGGVLFNVNTARTSEAETYQPTIGVMEDEEVVEGAEAEYLCIHPRDSVYSGAVKEGDSDAAQADENLRAKLTHPESKLPDILGFYAHGIPTPDQRRQDAWHAEREQSEYPPIKATSDERTMNNTMRHAYRVLNDEEKDMMQAIKDHGLQFIELLDTLPGSREISIAKTKMEEAVMWAVRGLTR